MQEERRWIALTNKQFKILLDAGELYDLFWFNFQLVKECEKCTAIRVGEQNGN